MKPFEERLKEVKEDAKAECEARGHHRWDRWLGRSRTIETKKYCFGDCDCENSEYYEIYERRCLDCDTFDSTEDPNEWLYDAGLGHYVCDPRTGKVHFEKK